MQASFQQKKAALPALQVAPDVWQIAPGYVPRMRAPVRLYASPELLRMLLEEVEKVCLLLE